MGDSADVVDDELDADPAFCRHHDLIEALLSNLPVNDSSASSAS